ncbi:hypothetical protein PA0218 [Candidatus Phytoplasma australiense]|uniref:Uncharacterized protein n=1 Tax=Phytoplasma australiense TaxID=59748 RepID=B1V9C1_PHYAS|nr:hypothetical protein PA0218 [Candidatus Phytoplasma australiense]
MWLIHCKCLIILMFIVSYFFKFVFKISFYKNVFRQNWKIIFSFKDFLKAKSCPYFFEADKINEKRHKKKTISKR